MFDEGLLYSIPNSNLIPTLCCILTASSTGSVKGTCINFLHQNIPYGFCLAILLLILLYLCLLLTHMPFLLLLSVLSCSILYTLNSSCLLLRLQVMGYTHHSCWVVFHLTMLGPFIPSTLMM